MASRPHRSLAGPLMVAPGVSGLVAFVALPFVLALLLSFTNLRFGSPLGIEFVGLEQFRRVLGDAVFRRALVNNAIFALVVVPAQTLLALSIALLLHQRLRGGVVFRALFFMPVVFPLSLVAVVWVLLYAPGADGFMNQLLSTLTLGRWVPRDFLHDPLLALPAIMLTSIWQGAGFQVVMLLAGLQAIPGQLYEAAWIDGAGAWQRFRYVTLPELRGMLLFVVLVTTILSFRLFDQVQIMTQGGPQNATTTVMYEAVRAAFERQQVARGTAMTVIAFVVVLALSWAQRRFAPGGSEAR